MKPVIGVDAEAIDEAVVEGGKCEGDIEEEKMPLAPIFSGSDAADDDDAAAAAAAAAAAVAGVTTVNNEAEDGNDDDAANLNEDGEGESDATASLIDCCSMSTEGRGAAIRGAAAETVAEVVIVVATPDVETTPEVAAPLAVRRNSAGAPPTLVDGQIKC